MKSYLSLIPISAKVRKKQNRMTILCIIISVFLVTAVFSMADMAVRMETKRLIKKHGNLHAMLNNTTENITENTALLGITGYSFVSYLRWLYVVAAVLALLVLIAGVFMIAGSINSNVAERTQFFGMLRCIGTSRKQIVKIVRLEALNWCKSAVPIGTAIGIVMTWILCAVLRIVSQSEFAMLPVFGISPAGIICGGVTGILTVLIAASAPAKRAAAVSPISAVTGNYVNSKMRKTHQMRKTQKMQAKDNNAGHAYKALEMLESPKTSEMPETTKAPEMRPVKLFFQKIEYNLGVHHAVSDKKNMVLMTGSFALSIILFLSFSIIVTWVHSVLDPLKWYASDFSIIRADRSCTIDRALIDEIEKQENVKLAIGRMFKNMPAYYEGKDANIDLISYDDYQFGCAKKDLAGGDISNVQGDSNCVLIVFDKSNTLKISDTIRLNDGTVLMVAGVLSESPFDSDDTPTVICSEETFMRLTGEKNYAEIDVRLSNRATNDDINELRDIVGDGYVIYDRLESHRETVSVFWAFSIFVYGFLFVIAMITVLNVFNSISMSVSAKIRQYGAMRAIGMEVRQLTLMIFTETITYVILGILTGCIIGLPLHKFLYSKMITHYFGVSWHVPIIQLLIAVLLMGISSLMAVRPPSRRIKNMAITEVINEL